MTNQESFSIRHAVQEDYDDIMRVYAAAHQIMRSAGNFRQWNGNYPESALQNDIEQGYIYVVLKNNRICASFVLIIGEDPTYRIIENGEWLSDAPYGTIHRIASDGTQKGIFGICIRWCRKQISHIRIDTHEDNKIMRHTVEKNGFSYCGIIYVADGTPRLAFEML